MNKKNVLTQEFVNSIYNSYRNAEISYHYADGFFIGLRDFGIITEEEYSLARQMNETAYDENKNFDRDPDWERDRD